MRTGCLAGLSFGPFVTLSVFQFYPFSSVLHSSWFVFFFTVMFAFFCVCILSLLVLSLYPLCLACLLTCFVGSTKPFASVHKKRPSKCQRVKLSLCFSLSSQGWSGFWLAYTSLDKVPLSEGKDHSFMFACSDFVFVCFFTACTIFCSFVVQFCLFFCEIMVILQSVPLCKPC